ncbi:MAG: flagellar biosynthesis protein FlgI [Oceanospirillales bacterium TMED59]|jgi:flagellar P-ring protein precursor FlgI|nr:MAG: flagellar biosynthesis protein FlgI [Oceanospirillales bacterium TMED59]
MTTVIKKIFKFCCAIVLIMGFISNANADRLKDLTSISGIRDNPLVGYGIVVGLAGSGDGNSGLLLQSMQAMVSQFGLVTDTAGLSGKNAAAVMVTAELPAFTKPGQAIDITVSTLGAAKSLRGGTLLMTPLKGADGETYAIAQGNLVVGGLGVEGGDGSSIIVNIPTVGRIPKGATVEKMVETPFLNSDVLILNLNQSDFSTASRVSEAINDVFGPEVSVPLDSSSIKVRAPIDKAQKVTFMSLLENVEVQPASPAAKVVVNARTGTIVIGGDVRVTPAVVTHGSLTVRVKEDMKTTQGQNIVANGQNAIVAGGDVVQTPDSELGFDAETARAFVFDPGVELSDIVDAVNNVGASAADLVSILDALRQAGALRAEIVVI